MKKYMLNLKENETMMNDTDYEMEKYFKYFNNKVSHLTENDLKLFNNWVKVYKILNYDIIDNLVVQEVYKLAENVAAVVVNYNGNLEFDLLRLNYEDMSVTILSAGNGKCKDHILRRLLVPSTVEDALMFTVKDIDDKHIQIVAVTIDTLKKEQSKYEVSNEILNDDSFIKVTEFKELEQENIIVQQQVEKPIDNNVQLENQESLQQQVFHQEQIIKQLLKQQEMQQKIIEQLQNQVQQQQQMLNDYLSNQEQIICNLYR